MKDELTCIIKDFDKKGVPGAIAVLCPEKQVETVENMLDGMPPLRLSENAGPIETDKELAAFAESVLQGCEYMIGAVARPEAETDYSCGAVIGFTNKLCSNADKQLLEVADDIWCWAYPGVCGFVLQGARSEAEQCVDRIYRSITRRTEPWYELADDLDDKTFIYVSDSTGRDCFTGGILAAGRRKE